VKRHIFLTDADCLLLKSQFAYQSGELVRRNTNKVVGAKSSSGYLNAWAYIARGQACLGVHRIIYAISRGPIPSGWDIDHINKIKTDNRIENLRAVDHPSNMVRNAVRKPLGLPRGVRQSSRNLAKPFVASARLNGIHICIGYFATRNEAATAYRSFTAGCRMCEPGEVLP
jgi:hypothetical protein